MIRAIQTIDSALKRFYRLENAMPAEQFLVHSASPNMLAVGSPLGNGALVIVDGSPTAGDLEVGIFFDKTVRATLQGFERWPRAEWTHVQTQAFSVAVEEVSHFNYLVERATRDQRVSQFEMELQGEVDRFVMAFLAERHQRKAPSFEELFARFFENFRWDDGLSVDRRTRYEDAHRMAKSLLARLRPAFKNHREWSNLVAELRRFYAASTPEKIRASQR